MPIQLDKILIDVSEEKILCPNYPDPQKREVDEAWIRVGRKNDLSVHEARSIFKVLQKKYEQEKVKERSGWKLFNIMHDIHKMNTPPDSTEEEALPMEEDEEYEMLEVQEEDEQQQQPNLYTGNSTTFGHIHSSGGEASDGESQPKSMKSESSHGSSPEHCEKKITKLATVSPQREEKKVLNSSVSTNVRNSTLILPASTAVALQKKGIIVKKTTNVKSAGNGILLAQQSKAIVRNGQQVLEVGKTIRMPESIKRKLSEEYSTLSSTKKIMYSSLITPNPTQQKTPLGKSPAVKKDSEVETTSIKTETKTENDEVGSSPTNSSNSKTSNQSGLRWLARIGNPTNTEANISLAVNGNAIAEATTGGGGGSTNNGVSSPRIEDMELCNDIIFEGNTSGVSSPPQQPPPQSANNNENSQQQQNKANVPLPQTDGILNLGNSDNILPRTFFKNLCTSNRYEALGLYVANAMNRMNSNIAARLEINILRAIIDAQNESSGFS